MAISPISEVSNVTDMRGMFAYSQFEGDLSNWNVSNAENVWERFVNCFTNKIPYLEKIDYKDRILAVEVYQLKQKLEKLITNNIAHIHS